MHHGTGGDDATTAEPRTTENHRPIANPYAVFQYYRRERLGAIETRKIREGDVICCPTGGPETAHQILNDSDADLAYLSVSTMMPAEVCEYPDSKKVGAFGGSFRHMTHTDDALDYWKDEVPSA